MRCALVGGVSLQIVETVTNVQVVLTFVLPSESIAVTYHEYESGGNAVEY